MDFCSGQGVNRSNSSTIARICNAALGKKTQFYVPDSMQHHTSTSARKFRNKMTPQLSIRVLPSEVPLDGPLFGISRLLPGINFGLQKFSTGNASIQALAGEDANFDLGHIQPARMLGCVMELHAAQEFLGSARSQHIVEALSEVGIEIVQHQVNSTRLGIDASEKPVDERLRSQSFPDGR